MMRCVPYNCGFVSNRNKCLILFNGQSLKTGSPNELRYRSIATLEYIKRICMLKLDFTGVMCHVIDRDILLR